MRVLNNAFDHPMDLEEKAVIPLAGGIMQHGHQCGMIWGAVIAAGAQAYRVFGAGPVAEVMSVMAAQGLAESYRARNKFINCLEITGLDKSSSALQMNAYFFLKGGVIKCGRMTVRFAKEAFSIINTTFTREGIEAPSPPVSCAGLLAEKMGLPGIHRVMVSGLAGGIGLSGGACGALGTAVWTRELSSLKQGAGNYDYNDPRAVDLVDKFRKFTNSEFECSKIVKKRFRNVDEHAAFLNNGGCSELIDLLGAE